MSADRKLIFVYGTLKRGGSNHHYLARQKFLGEARTASGFRLYDLSGYPGMVARPDEPDGVVGEVWSVDSATLSDVDQLEGLSEGLYRREVVPLLPPFAGQRVEGYLYARDVTGCRVLGPVWNT